MPSNLRYPPWVRKGQLILGDVCYLKVQGEWQKMYYTGRTWVSKRLAPSSLIQQSEHREKMMAHVGRQRKD